MDGRTKLLLACGLFGGLAGCSHQSSMPLQQSQEPPIAASKNGPASGKRDPLPSTCIALGRTSERAAEVAGRSPADQQKLREQARRSYQKALQLDPTNLEAMSCLGNLYLTLNDYPRAVATFRKATEAGPTKANVWYELGLCYTRSKDWEPALAALQKAVELEPEDRLFVHSYGYCLARAGRYEASVAAFARVENEAMAHFNVARMLMHMNEEELARQHLRLAVALDKNLTPASELLAKLDLRVSMGVPSAVDQPAIQQAGYERPAVAQPIIKLLGYEETNIAPPGAPSTGNQKPASAGDDPGAPDGSFSRSAAAALHRINDAP
jgi:tetratricopeptide (TPR) repeat protein